MRCTFFFGFGVQQSRARVSLECDNTDGIASRLNVHKPKLTKQLRNIWGWRRQHASIRDEIRSWMSKGLRGPEQEKEHQESKR